MPAGATEGGSAMATSGGSGGPGGTTTDGGSTGDPDPSETDGTGTSDSGTPAGCTPPPLLQLDAIPDDPSLAPDNQDILATFEVDGHDLVGKFVRDVPAAQGGLKLWQEFTLRIPENQLLDLVQLDIYADTDPVAYFNRTGNVTTERLGLKLGFSTLNFELNQDDPCAPLEPRRGTFDWSLVHEFGHLRGWVDGSWPKFLDTFPDVQGDGDGYPEDGSPILTGDFVTSYAERADGDEDHAESWTTFVMLAESELPPPSDDEPLALQKVRWMANQPDLIELREAIRITEGDAMDVTVPPAPRLDPSSINPPDDSGGDVGVEPIEVPAELHGVWQQSATDGVHVTMSATDIVLSRYESGVEVERLSLAEEAAADQLFYFEIHDGASATLAYSFIGAPDTERFNHDFFLQDDGQSVVFQREIYDPATNELEYLPELTLTRP